MSWFKHEERDYWDVVIEGNQDYLDNYEPLRGFWDTKNHLGTLDDQIHELISIWDSRHPDEQEDRW